MAKVDVVIVRNQEVFVGIDVSAGSYAVAVRSGRQLVFRGTVPAQYAHLRALWARLPGSPNPRVSDGNRRSFDQNRGDFRETSHALAAGMNPRTSAWRSANARRCVELGG